MSLTRLIPGPDQTWNADDPGLMSALTELYAPPARPGGSIRINMIASLNGSAVGGDGTSETLSNRMDRAILKVIRSLADVVVVGAETVRREGYLGPKDSTLAVVTASGNLTGHRLHHAARPPVILRPESAAARVEEQLAGIDHRQIALRSSDLDALEIVAALRQADLPNMVCEGGPTLAAAFLAAGVVDELCLTTAPRLHAPGTPLIPGLDRTVETDLRQLLVDGTGMLYARWGIGTEKH